MSDNNDTIQPTTAPAETPPAKKPRGFAAMSREMVASIARKGGRAAHAAGTAHEFTREEAIEAGRRGGRSTASKTKK